MRCQSSWPPGSWLLHSWSLRMLQQQYYPQQGQHTQQQYHPQQAQQLQQQHYYPQGGPPLATASAWPLPQQQACPPP